ncbi:MAG: hypothetical protein IJV41_11720 [Oscillospiraceae bacterium]|nr:hypothetical protein [Oscillospiraceae bacterium]
MKKMLLALDKFKYPLIILILGIILMLLPSGHGSEETVPEGDALLAQVLSSTKGVGEAKVLISDSGVVVVCSGAGNASVRLDIIRAVRSYTGFGSDKITILQLVN